MRIFPTVVKRVVSGVASAIDGVISLGARNEQITGFLAALTHSVGSEGRSLAHTALATFSTGVRATSGPTVTAAGSLPVGSRNEQITGFAGLFAGSLGAIGRSMDHTALAVFTTGSRGLTGPVASDIGSSSVTTGSRGASISSVLATLAAQSAGTQSRSMAAASTITANGFPSTATNTTNAGTTPWATPTNAQGDFNATEANLTSAATPTAAASHDATLKINGFALGSAPSGWTRTKVEVVIRHRWDLTVGALSTASIEVTLRDSADAVLATPVARAQGSGNQATLLTEAFDVTSVVTALTDAQVAACKVWCRGVCNLLVITGGNASWQVDAAHLRTTYTRAVLS